MIDPHRRNDLLSTIKHLKIISTILYVMIVPASLFLSYFIVRAEYKGAAVQVIAFGVIIFGIEFNKKYIGRYREELGEK